jgi:hypothetical protein
VQGLIEGRGELAEDATEAYLKAGKRKKWPAQQPTGSGVVIATDRPIDGLF